MRRLKYLAATAVLALTVGSANAITFDISGNLINSNAPPATLALGGTLNIDTANGTVTSADITLPGYPAFTHLFADGTVGAGRPVPASDILLSFNPASETFVPPFDLFQISLVFPTDSLVNYAGGAIWATMTVDQHLGAVLAECSESPFTFCAALSLDSALDSASATPLPAALPLFASGLGALGLLGWRRKQKAAIAA